MSDNETEKKETIRKIAIHKTYTIEWRKKKNAYLTSIRMRVIFFR